MADSVRVPLSTYRLQFNSTFTFRDAAAIVDYLAALGVSDCYASSYLKAVPGSLHGYDVADPTRFNPEIGTTDDYWNWIDALHARGMSHVLDVVPNHMGIAKSANPWWYDVLENGPSSRFARFFDIEWRPLKTELADKLLIPILGDQYGEVLERKELQLAFRNGSFVVSYFDDVLPIATDTYPDILAGVGDELERSAADELAAIVEDCRRLPARSSREREPVLIRSREKERIKQRLASLAQRNETVQASIARAVERLNGVAGQPRTFDDLDRLLNEQSYRLAHWRVASEEINYRRFFDINQLAALRMEDPEVFEEVHGFVFDLVRRGAAAGLRIDHVDGLYMPREYLERLQARVERPIFIVVEKILGSDESLPAEWPVHGTTGYEFAAVVNNLFVDARSQRAMDDIYARFVHERFSFSDLAYRSKRLIMHETMSGDINSLGHQLNRFSERNRHYRDFTLYSLISTIKEIIACFPVYRTYITPDEPVSAHDRRYIAEAVRCAKRRATAIPPVVFDFVERLLTKQRTITEPAECEERARFTGKFQQITSPIAAKGIEDTASYIYNRLLSLNEVGADPTRFGVSPEYVHAWMAERQRRWPHALSATATHDTKRGEDVRARINILSEIPGAWRAAVTKWRALNRRHKTNLRGAFAPDANEEYLLYQTLVGMCPFDARVETIRGRLQEYSTKALREAKVHTSWMSPDEEYEQAVHRFIERILDRQRSGPFLQSFEPFQARVAELGIYNSLSQLLIKIAAPGVPDFYQGTEVWDLHLVDPDNRRAVDYAARRELLAGLVCPSPQSCSLPSQLLDQRADGRVKLFATMRALAARCRFRAVFEHGEYVPIAATGSRRDCVFSFARRGHDGTAAIVAVPRLVATLVPDAASPPIGSAVWGDTRLKLPWHDRVVCQNVFTSQTVEADAGDDGPSLSAAQVFERFPIALLVPAQ